MSDSLFVRLRRFRERLVAGDSGAPGSVQTVRATAGWALAGFACLCAALVILEIGQPYYFSQDDVLVGEMPGVLQGCRAIWQGVVPWFNPSTLMGTPLASTGGAGLTYPPTLVSYAVARHLLGNEFATMEVFAILHLLAGFFCLFWAARRLGMGGMPAALTSLSFVLSGSILIIGRSWHSFVTLAVWLPLLAVSVTGVRRGKLGAKWLAGTAAAIGIPYHVGFPQIWAYSLGFFAIAAIWSLAARKASWRDYVSLAAAFGLGLALVLPVAAMQLSGASRLARSSGFGGGIGSGLLSLLIPYPLASSPHPNLWGNEYLGLMGQMYYSGTILISLAVLLLVALLFTKPRASVWNDKPWVVCAVLAFLGALGPSTAVWILLSHLPVLGRVNNHPLRLLPFVVFFGVLTGGLVLERLLEMSRKRSFHELVVMLAGCAMLFYHAALAKPSFYAYGFRPYPPLEPAIKTNVVYPGDFGPKWRLLAVAPLRSPDRGYAQSLAHNLPAVYGAYSFSGYDPVAENSPPWTGMFQRLQASPLAAARAYGVRWLLLYRPDPRNASAAPFSARLERTIPFGQALVKIPESETKRVYDAGPITLLELAGTASLAFAADAPEVPLPLKTTGGAIDVDVSSLKRPVPVILNFAWYPEMKVRIDGKDAAAAPDEWSRVKVVVPEKARLLTLRYLPGWKKGVIAGTLSLLVSLCAVAATRWKAPGRTRGPKILGNEEAGRPKSD